MLIRLARQALPPSPSDSENDVPGDDAVTHWWARGPGLGPGAVSHPSESQTVSATALRLYPHGQAPSLDSGFISTTDEQLRDSTQVMERF